MFYWYKRLKIYDIQQGIYSKNVHKYLLVPYALRHENKYNFILY